MPESGPKRKVKLAISSAIWGLDRVLGLIGVSKRSRSGGVVLLYHDVDDAQVQQFADHVGFLQSHYQLVPLERMHDSASVGRRVAITFDDALKSFSENAVPVLAEQQTPATLFVPSELVARNEPGYMTASEVSSLPSFIEVGSHSRMHRRLSDLNTTELNLEVAGSKTDLEAMTGRVVASFAFPFGDTNESIEKSTVDAGYQRSYSVRPGVVGREMHRIPRTTLEPTDTLFELRLKADGAYRWMGALMAARHRFLGHNV